MDFRRINKIPSHGDMAMRGGIFYLSSLPAVFLCNVHRRPSIGAHRSFPQVEGILHFLVDCMMSIHFPIGSDRG